MLDLVKMALRIFSDAYDDELELLIAAAEEDLGIAGVANIDETDPIVVKAIISYCKLQFGIPDDVDRLQKSYDEQKAQLATHTGHTDWLED